MSQQSALKTAAKVLDERSWESAFADVKPRVTDFASGNGSILFGLAPLAEIAGCRAFEQQIKDGPDAEINWADWRLSIEIRLLDFRANASGGSRTMSSWVVVSPDLQLGIALALLGQDKMAKTVLNSVIPGLSPVAEKIEIGLGKQADMSAIGYILGAEIGKVPSHSAFTRSKLSQEPDPLKTARIGRNGYSKTGHIGGSLLGGPACDLVPLELIYLNKALNLDNHAFDAMAAKISETAYPEVEDFIELDTDITIAGY